MEKSIAHIIQLGGGIFIKVLVRNYKSEFLDKSESCLCIVSRWFGFKT